MDVLWINVKYIARIIKRFTLQVSRQIPEAIPLLRLVVPVTQADELLLETKSQADDNDLSAAAGTYVPYFECPTGKRWILNRWRKGGTVANTRLSVKVDSASANHQYNLTGKTEEAEHFNGLKVKEGGSIGLSTTGDGGDTAISLTIFYEEEDSF